MDDERLVIEGLAAQLYVQASNGGHFAWWHVASDAIKEKFRAQAEQRIADFRRKTPF
jgi:hypothetical protein